MNNSVMKTVVNKINRNSSGVIESYTLRNVEGITFEIKSITLKEKIRNGEISVENLKLTRNNRLMQASPNKVYKVPENVCELGMYDFNGCHIMDIHFDRIFYSDKSSSIKGGIIYNLRMNIITCIGTNIDILFEKTRFITNSEHYYYGVKFDCTLLNALIMSYITDNFGSEKTEVVKKFMDSLVMASKDTIEKSQADEKKKVREIKISVKLHDCAMNINGMNVHIHEGTLVLPSCKNALECCEVVSNFINQLDIAKYMSRAIARELGVNGQLERRIKIFTDNRRSSGEQNVYKSATYISHKEEADGSIIKHNSWFKVFCEVKWNE